ncbi:efflux RND transporter periplasmic adaptor subunit [Psychromarinibacter sp. C21-152]|uniref:Efflux RND transporter periplasmic adaptor subunit n=1 Tax=Psychromarinibacter sediminicola TaxID=3033385 RepID=A0AAE3T9C0_9RHOB|nr:efflux RND transporter periplasmic adaptor subunit [Psychromarinibacter sediminicola]MDF0602017.1 efflux RND transporter periplasmic adaptor subunit [Psychromarinibacter sediminicola]
MSEKPDAERATARADLTFETDPGAARSLWTACAILLAILLWMGSGFVRTDPPASEPAEAAAPPPSSVVVRESVAEPVPMSFSAQGQALPERDTEIVTEASGTVASVPVSKGQVVARGAVIAQLNADSAEAALAQAEEERDRAQRELDNATTLRDRGVGTVDRVAEARATLAAAESQVSAARDTLDTLTVTAPFAGRIEDLMINDGEYAAAGDPVARLVDNHPITVAFEIPQQNRAGIETGSPAEVRFVTGQTREGEVTFVGTAASPETRTFLAEVQVPNEDGAILAGVSAEVTIRTGEETAHFVDASVVSLNPEGRTGIKTVVDGVVQFHEVDLINAEIGGLWATGLPETAQIIVVGQGFVREGEAVRVQRDDAPGRSEHAGLEEQGEADQ